MTSFKDTDYLHASARVRVIEKNLLGGEDLKKMAEARSLDEAWKIANDAGIGVGMPVEDYERALDDSLERAYAEANDLLHGSEALSLFRMKYDAHNLKTLVKSVKAGKRPELLSPLGNVPVEKLSEELDARAFGPELSPELAAAAISAVEKLAKNGDPQAVDLAIDRAWLTAVNKKAAGYDNAFIREWARTQTDLANIRALFRIKRMGRDGSLLLEAAAPGGTFEPKELAAAAGENWDDVFALADRAPCSKYIAAAFEDVKNGKSLSRFERLCDNAAVAVLVKARYVPFGIEPVLAWLLAKENEAQAARIVLACKRAGLSSADIIERLRDSYAQ